MDSVTRNCCIDVHIGLPKKRFSKRKIQVFAEKLPLFLRFLKAYRLCQTENILLHELIHFAEQNEGKVLALFANTPEGENFIEKNTAALEPFYRIDPKGAPYDT